MDEEITCATFVRAAPEKVYDAIATAEGLDGRFTSGARVDAPGGAIHFSWKGWGADRITHEATGCVLEAIKPKRFVFQWFPTIPRMRRPSRSTSSLVTGGRSFACRNTAITTRQAVAKVG